MTILFKYIFRQFFWTSCTLICLIISLLWLAQSLRYMDLIINNSLSIVSFFQLVMFLLPDLFVIISPIAFAVAMIFCFHKLMISHELSALRALGMSNIRLASPILAMSAGLFSLLLTLNLLIVPASFQKFREQQHLLKSAFSGMLLREGSFNTSKSFTVYVREHNDEDILKGVFIFQPAKNGKPAFTTLAEVGQVYTQGDRLFVKLLKGQRQEFKPDTKVTSSLSFDEFVYDLTDEVTSNQKQSEKPSEKSIRQLLNPNPQMVDDMKNRFRVEAHQRILLPCLCMLDALLIASILLTGEVGRRYNRKKLLWAALAVLFMHVGILGGLNRSVEYVWGIAILYSIVGIGLIASCLYLCRDLLWHYRLPFSRNPKGPSHA